MIGIENQTSFHTSRQKWIFFLLREGKLVADWYAQCMLKCPFADAGSRFSAQFNAEIDGACHGKKIN